jgi:hypothetical protein
MPSCGAVEARTWRRWHKERKGRRRQSPLPFAAKAQRKATVLRYPPCVRRAWATPGPAAIGIALDGAGATPRQVSDTGVPIHGRAVLTRWPSHACLSWACHRTLTGEKPLLRSGRARSDRPAASVSPRLLEECEPPTTTCFRGFEVWTTAPQLTWKRLLREQWSTHCSLRLARTSNGRHVWT